MPAPIATSNTRMAGTSHAGRDAAAGGSAKVAAGVAAGAAGSTTVGASSSVIARSSSAQTAPNPCGRSAGFLAVQPAIRWQTDGGTPASYSGSIFNGSLQKALEKPPT